MALSKKGHIEVFFRENYSRLFYYACRLVEDRATAEDVVHDVFVKIWKQFEAGTREAPSRSYVYTAIRNTCLNNLRHNRIRKEFAGRIGPEAFQEQERGLDLIIRAEVLGQVHQAIESLPEGCREVLKLAYFESLKNEEIAARLGVSINTIKTQKARAISLLRLRLDTTAFMFFISAFIRTL